MKKVSMVLAWCVFLFMHGIAEGQTASPPSDTLTIHISGRHYPKLNLVFGLEDKGYHVSEGVMIAEDTWQFVYPRGIYDKHLHVRLSVKERIPDRVIYLRTAINDQPLMTEFFGVPEAGGKLSLLFEKNVEDIVYNKGYTSDILNVENPDFEVFSNLQCAFLQREYSYDRYLSEIRKLIKRHPDSHYIMVRIWEFERIFKSRRDMSMLYNSFSEAARNSYFGKKAKALIDAKE